MKSLTPELTSQIRDAQTLGLTQIAPNALEKDVHISSVLNTVAQLSQQNYTLVFCGGTSLVKAHRIVQRMSEDVDFKIVLEEGLSTSARRNLLSRIKKEFAGLLDETDFSRSDFNAGNNNSHFSLNVGYQTLFETTATLRPEIKVEFTTSSTALPPQLLTATTLIGDLIPEHQAPVELLCLSLEETAAEKVVSFLRRSLPYFREFTGQYEGQLVRHIYDVHMLSLSQIDLSSARPAAEHAFTHDALRYANTSSVFATEPREELLTALTKLDKEEISQNYDLFVADLLSNEGPPLDEALDSFIRVAHALLD